MSNARQQFCLARFKRVSSVRLSSYVREDVEVFEAQFLCFVMHGCRADPGTFCGVGSTLKG